MCAGTALGILPFLGEGHTHRQGKFKEQIQLGLNYLVGAMVSDGQRGGSLIERRGDNYAHGLTSIAILEVYSMTGDQELKRPD